MKKAFIILSLTMLFTAVTSYKVYELSKIDVPEKIEMASAKEPSRNDENTGTVTAEKPGSNGNGAGNEVDDNKGSFLEYKNPEFNFNFSLPASWKGYSVINDRWEDNQGYQSGPKIILRHPEWTENDPRQDIPVMVFTHEQWQQIANEELLIGAAPIGPDFLAENDNYIFAIPARYNFSFPTGYEEVEEIIEMNRTKEN